MSKIEVDKIDPQSGTALEVGTSGDTVTVPSGVGLTLTDSTLLLPTTINTDKIDPKSGTALEIGTSGDTITVPTGAGLTVTDEVKTNKISPATGVAFALGDSGDTFTIPSGATIDNLGTATGFGESNTPAFFATPSGNQTISNVTFTKMTFDTEVLDTNSAYDTSASTFTVPAGEGGLYCFYNNIRMPLDDGEEGVTFINVDTVSQNATGTQNYPGANAPFYHAASTLINLDATDVCYLEMYVASTASLTTTASYCYFGGFKVT